MRIDQFEMERMQSIHWHEVKYDLSESGVTPLTPGKLSDEMASIAMESEKREWILARTRQILNRQLPRLEEWIGIHRDTW